MSRNQASNASGSFKTSPSFPCGLINNRTLSQAKADIAGSKAEYRREDYVFPREQSRTMRSLEWEDTCGPQPLPIWGRVFQFNIGFWGLFGPFLAVATGVWK